MFEEVCRYLQTCNAVSKEKQMISINVSRQHFQEPAFLEEYAEIKERYGIGDDQIELELTFVVHWMILAQDFLLWVY